MSGFIRNVKDFLVYPYYFAEFFPRLEYIDSWCYFPDTTKLWRNLELGYQTTEAIQNSANLCLYQNKMQEQEIRLDKSRRLWHNPDPILTQGFVGFTRMSRKGVPRALVAGQRKESEGVWDVQLPGVSHDGKNTPAIYTFPLRP